MNNETQEILQQLAIKLNTTVEHLWGTLINQAPISGTINCLVILIWFICSFVSLLCIKRTNNEEIKFLSSMFWWLFNAIAFLIVGLALENILSSFFNPEYWALIKILAVTAN